MSENNPLFFGFISEELRDPKWRWNETISFAAEIDADHLRAKWYIAYDALFKTRSCHNESRYESGPVQKDKCIYY